MSAQMDLFGAAAPAADAALADEDPASATTGDEVLRPGARGTRASATNGDAREDSRFTRTTSSSTATVGDVGDHADDLADSLFARATGPGASNIGDAEARASDLVDLPHGAPTHATDVVTPHRAPNSSTSAPEAPRSAPPTTEPDAPIAARSLLVIDGTALIFRAYYGLGSRRAPNGAEVGAVTGVCHQLLGVLRRQPAERVVVVFDAAQETFRNRIDPRYKANRGDPPDELVPQFDLIKEITRAAGLCTLAKIDFEADDLMATLAALARAAGIPARLVAVDKDLCQSVVDDAPRCDLYDPKTEELTDGAGVVRRLGVRPEQVVDLMALTGDSTDNIQGVRGVGPKAAVALLEAFGDLDGVYRNLDRVEYLGIRGAKALAKKLEEGRDEAFLARRLTRLDAAVDLGIAADALVDATTWRGPRPDADPLFAEYGLRGPLTGLRRLFEARPLA